MKSTAKVSWQLWRDRRGRLSPLRIGTLALLLFPIAKALVEAQSIVHGARPLNDMIHRAGFWALVFLGVTLAVTPLRRVVRYGNLIDVRRMLGVGHFAILRPISRFSPPARCSTSARWRTRSAIAGISSLAARLGWAWRHSPRPRPTAWCAGSGHCAGGGCTESSMASCCWR